MKNLQIFENEKFGEVRTLKKDNEILFVAKDVCDILGANNTTSAINRLPEHLKKKAKISHPQSSSKKIKVNLINKKGISYLVSSSRKPEAKLLAKKLNYYLITSKEQDTLETVIKAFEGLVDYKTQYSVGRYRIDLYIPEFKIAVECDEYNHKDRNRKKEIKREDFIKRKLNCKFIRFSPDDPNFNIGEIINEIFREVLINDRNKRIS